MAGTSTRENSLKETVTLKWCTPRTNSIGGHGQQDPVYSSNCLTLAIRVRFTECFCFSPHQSCITVQEPIASPPQTSTVVRRLV